MHSGTYSGCNGWEGAQNRKGKDVGIMQMCMTAGTDVEHVKCRCSCGS